MVVTTNWTEKYKSKILTANAAIKKIKRGARIFLGTGCGVPYHDVSGILVMCQKIYIGSVRFNILFL